MYGVILMAALSTAPTTQGFCFRGCGCMGGCHAARSSCGGCNGGCHAARSWCGGCNGGCYASRYSCGGCYGCHGWSSGAHGYGCFGCNGYYGASYSAYACHGCHAVGFLQCHGCHGGHGCYAGNGGHGGYVANGRYAMPYANVEPAPPSDPGVRPETKPGKIERTPPPREQQKTEEVRARIVVDVPADAKLYIDGQLMQAQQADSARRIFQTPDLKSGAAYFYDVKAEIVRNGQVVSESQRIVLRPGRESLASFANLGETTPSATARAKE